MLSVVLYTLDLR